MNTSICLNETRNQREKTKAAFRVMWQLAHLEFFNEST